MRCHILKLDLMFVTFVCNKTELHRETHQTSFCFGPTSGTAFIRNLWQQRFKKAHCTFELKIKFNSAQIRKRHSWTSHLVSKKIYLIVLKKS